MHIRTVCFLLNPSLCMSMSLLESTRLIYGNMATYKIFEHERLPEGHFSCSLLKYSNTPSTGSWESDPQSRLPDGIYFLFTVLIINFFNTVYSTVKL